MSRVAHTFSKTNIVSIILALAVIAAGIAGTEYRHSHPAPQVTGVASETTDVKYQGQEGQTALSLLKKYTTVQVKHYSFGDQVISINSAAGNGPKYWSFYLNGKLANVGAGAYVTKSTDHIEWKLQKL